MAEHFGDTETMSKILDAPSTIKAEEAMKDIKDFDEAKWNEVSWNLSSFFISQWDTCCDCTSVCVEGSSVLFFVNKLIFQVKMNVWETGQRLKLEQTRWIANLLVYTGKTYIAVASQDKVRIF